MNISGTWTRARTKSVFDRYLWDSSCYLVWKPYFETRSGHSHNEKKTPPKSLKRFLFWQRWCKKLHGNESVSVKKNKKSVRESKWTCFCLFTSQKWLWIVIWVLRTRQNHSYKKLFTPSVVQAFVNKRVGTVKYCVTQRKVSEYSMKITNEIVLD